MLPGDLELATVRLTSQKRLLGSGFFVGPGLVATCVHVVGQRKSIDVEFRGENHPGDVVRCERQDSVGDNLFPDLALIHVRTIDGRPVELDGSCSPTDRLYAWGFPQLASDGDSIEGECEGFRNFGRLDSQRLIKFKETQITGGLSGSPVLNLRTGKVCGMLKRTRDEQSSAGGYAVQAAILLTAPEVATAQRQLETPLRTQLREYLDKVVHDSGLLPKYYPLHIRSFDNIRQRVRVIPDRRRFYTPVEEWLPRATESPHDPYDPLHSRPEDLALDGRSLFERSIQRWWIERIGALEWDRLRNDARFRQLVILGDPGFGKTWLLRHEARRRALDCRALLGDDLPGKLTIPVLMKLQDLARHVSKTQTLAQTLDLALESDGLRPELRTYVAQQLAHGRVALLLDAWDEVEYDRRSPLRHQIDIWVRSYQGPMVLTSRPARFGHFAFGEAPVLELLAFEHSEIRSFVRTWFNARMSQQFLETLNAHRSISGLARIPLMLALLCRVFDDPTRKLPVRRGELCDRCLRGLLKDWKREDKAAEVDDLDVETAFSRVGQIALALYPASQFAITEVAKELALPPAEARKTIDGLIEDGILIRTSSRSDDRLTFLHRTLHEYLAAREWSRQPWNQREVDARSWDVTWVQVFILLAGQLPDNTPLISALLREKADDEYRPRLALAIRCLQEAVDRSRCQRLIDQATEQAVDLWLAHSRNDTRQVLIRLESALPALPELGGHYHGVPFLTYLIHADVPAFLALLSGAGPNAATAEVIARLAGLLRDTDPAIRQKAAEAAGRLGPRGAVPEVLSGLIDLSREESWDRTQTALNSLANLGEDAATPEVLALLTEGIRRADSPFLWMASEVLPAMGQKAATAEVLERLIESMRQPRLEERSSAASMLRSMGEYAVTSTTLASLVDSIQEGASKVRQPAAEVLISMGQRAATPEVLSRLIELLRHPNSGVAGSAAYALGNLRQDAATPQVLGSLLELMREPSAEVRWIAAYTLGGIGKAAATPEVLEELLRLTEDPDWMVRWRATEALSHMGEAAATPKFVLRLVELIRDGDRVVRWKAAEGLSRFAENTTISGVLGELIQLMRHPEPEVRGRAASVVGNMAQDATSAETVAHLLDLTRDHHPIAGAMAVEALALLADKMRSPESEKVLARLLQLSHEDNGALRAAAAASLGFFSEIAQTPGALARLLELIRDPDWQVSSRAADAVARLKGRAATPEVLATLTEWIRDPSDIVCGRALEEFWRLGENAVVPETLGGLLTLTHEADSRISRRAIDALGRLGEAAATPAVLARLVEFGRGADRYRRATVLEALERFGERAATPEVVIWLQELMRDPDPAGRRAAAKTLGLLERASPNLRIPRTH